MQSHGFKIKSIITYMLISIITMLITLSILIYTDSKIEIYAGANDTGNSTNMNLPSAQGGCSFSRTCWLFYMIDNTSNNQIISGDGHPVVAGFINGRTPYNNPGTPVIFDRMVARYAGGSVTPSSNTDATSLGYCCTNGGGTRYSEIKSWLESPHGAADSGANDIIKSCWPTTFEKMQNDASYREKVYLILEACAWGKGTWRSGGQIPDGTGTFAMSSSGAGQFAFVTSTFTNDPAFKGWMFTRALQITNSFAEEWPGLDKGVNISAVPPDLSDTFKSWEQILGYGYGIAAFRVKDGGGVDTYNHISSPGDPEHEPEGKCNIVKDYIKVTRTEGV